MHLNPIGAPKTPEPESAIICPSTAVRRASRSPPTARGPLPAVRGARGPAGRSWGHRQDMPAHPSLCRPPPPWNPRLLRAAAGSPARRGPSQASDFMLQASIPRTPAGEPGRPSPLLLTELEQTQGESRAVLALVSFCSCDQVPTASLA